MNAREFFQPTKTTRAAMASLGAAEAAVPAKAAALALLRALAEDQLSRTL